MRANNNTVHLYPLLAVLVGLLGCPPPEPQSGVDTGDSGEVISVDEDEDGFTVADGDCDDSNPTVYPGAEEICDGMDSDCDGLLPIDDPDTDQDADGFSACVDDCDDDDPTVHPGAIEIPGDGIDQDCDGEDALLGSPCEVEIIGELSGEPGDEIVIQWEGGPFEDIQIRVFSGWGSENYLNIVVPAGIGSDGSYSWILPADLDPSLDYHVYVESAQGGVPTEQCWDYAPIDVQSSVCVLEFNSELSGEPGDEIDITWDVPVGEVDQIQIRVFSGWSPAVGYLNTIVDASDGTYTWDLPETLDPSLDHHVYIESAASGVPNEQCWRYAPLSVN